MWLWVFRCDRIIIRGDSKSFTVDVLFFVDLNSSQNSFADCE